MLNDLDIVNNEMEKLYNNGGQMLNNNLELASLKIISSNNENLPISVINTISFDEKKLQELKEFKSDYDEILFILDNSNKRIQSILNEIHLKKQKKGKK